MQPTHHSNWTTIHPSKTTYKCHFRQQQSPKGKGAWGRKRKRTTEQPSERASTNNKSNSIKYFELNYSVLSCQPYENTQDHSTCHTLPVPMYTHCSRFPQGNPPAPHHRTHRLRSWHRFAKSILPPGKRGELEATAPLHADLQPAPGLPIKRSYAPWWLGGWGVE